MIASARPAAPDLARRLARAYSALFHGLLWVGSEGDDPFQPFSAPFDPVAALTETSFREAAAVAAAWRIELAPAAPWFARMIEYFHENQYSGGDDHPLELAYRHLQRMMEATLDGAPQLASVHYASDGPFHKARYYLVGRVAEGGLAGLLAHSVET